MTEEDFKNCIQECGKLAEKRLISKSHMARAGHNVSFDDYKLLSNYIDEHNKSTRKPIEELKENLAVNVINLMYILVNLNIKVSNSYYLNTASESPNSAGKAGSEVKFEIKYSPEIRFDKEQSELKIFLYFSSPTSENEVPYVTELMLRLSKSQWQKLLKSLNPADLLLLKGYIMMEFVNTKDTRVNNHNLVAYSSITVEAIEDALSTQLFEH